MEITGLEGGKLVRWQVIQPVWPIEATEPIITWTLIPFEGSTLVDFRMEGWPHADGDRSTQMARPAANELGHTLAA
jgi:hypothetical protein